jgi:hypothetical protein
LVHLPKGRCAELDDRPKCRTWQEVTPDSQRGAINLSSSLAAYQEMLGAGIAREVARAVLPVGLFSSMYVTCNARSLMAFLSLRTKDDRATLPSFPQREIEMVAERMETLGGEDAIDPSCVQHQRPRRPLGSAVRVWRAGAGDPSVRRQVILSSPSGDR